MGLTTLENKLVTSGWNTFTVDEKNIFIQYLARIAVKPITEITDDYILNYHRQVKVYILDQDCENAILQGFTSANGHIYRTNRDDQINMIGQKDALLNDTTITDVQWKTEDVGYISHTRDEWLSVYNEAFQDKKTKLLKFNSLKLQVLDTVNTTTHEQIITITW